MRLIPRDEGFFELFDGIAQRLTRSAALLDDLFNDPTRLQHYVEQIKQVEREADDLVHEVMNRIDKSFVTPLDREDIHLLATSLDNVVDLMDGTARRAQMFNVTDRREPAKALAKLLLEASEGIAKAVAAIKDPRAVLASAREIKKLEEAGDRVYSDAVGALFRQPGVDPLEVVKWKELYDNLEHALDECEDVMNVLESIALKNS